MLIAPIHNEPALLIENKNRILVVADLHIGIERELLELGFHIPSQTEKILNHLLQLCIKNRIDTLILLGDIKHQIPTISHQEDREIPELFSKLKNAVREIQIVPGNHDGNLRYLVPKEVKIYSSKGFTIEKVGFVHGHTYPSKEVMSSKIVIVGHNHPIIMLKDKLGGKKFEQCWLKCKPIKKALHKYYPNTSPEQVIMPSLNELCGGIAINDSNSKLLGPLMTKRMFDLKNAQIYLLDGTFLGKLKNTIS